jgi:hypothetical protein
MSALVFLDTETTGLHASREAWEVAMIRREGSGGSSSIRLLIDVDVSRADPFALRIGGFYERHPMGRRLANRATDADQVVNAPEAAVEIAAWTHGAHIVGAVPSFDTETLARLLRRHKIAPAWHHHLIDVEALALGFLAARGETVALPWKSDDLSRRCGVEPPGEDERHTAMGDARWVMRLYDAITEARS